MSDRVVMRSHDGVGEISAPARHVEALVAQGWTPVEPLADEKPEPKPAPRRRTAPKKKS